MPITTISSILSSVKTASDIGNLLISSHSAYDKAQLKIEIEKLIDALHEVKQQSRAIEDVIYDKDQEIKQLKAQLAERNAAPKVGHYQDAVYKLDDNNWPKGNPYCPACFASDEKLLPVTPLGLIQGTSRCGSCKTTYKTINTPASVHKKLEQQKARSEAFEPDVEILN